MVPTDFSYKPYHTDPQLYQHFSRLCDAATKGRITSSTTLAALYGFTRADGVDDVLLRNLTGVVAPAVECQMKLPNGSLFPPSRENCTGGYEMELTYNRLVGCSQPIEAGTLADRATADCTDCPLGL